MTTNTIATGIGALAIALDAFAIFRAVSRDHGVERTLAWIFAILALPGVGALAYLAVASPSVRRTTRRKTETAAALEEAALDASRTKGAEESLFELATRLTGLPPTRANRVRHLAEDEHAFERIQSSIRSAKESVLAEYYLVRNDATGHRFLELLTEKASQGIDVRLIYDAVGSLGLDALRLEKLKRAGGRTAMFLPLNPLRKRWAVHLRNHRKLVVIDDRVVYTGGMNIGDEYSGRSRRRGDQHFRDTHLEIEGAAARCFRQVFLEDWMFASDSPLDLSHTNQDGAAIGREADPSATAVVSAIPSGPDQTHNASWHVYFAAIAMARERLFLTSPYFIPDPAIEKALLNAALRGVDVRILLPSRCDVRLAGAAARSYYRSLLESGVRLFHFQPSMLHAKALLVDDTACVVGSANFDIRSFRLNFEIGALVRDTAFLEDMSQQFERDVGESREVELAEIQSRGLLPRLLDSSARLLSPLL